MNMFAMVFLIMVYQTSGFIINSDNILPDTSSSKSRLPVSSFQSTRAALHFRGYLELKRSIRQKLSSHHSSHPITFNHQKLQIIEELLEITRRELITLHSENKLNSMNMTLIMGEGFKPKDIQHFKDKLNALLINDHHAIINQSEVIKALPILSKNIEHLAHQLDSKFKIKPITNISFTPQSIKHP